MLVIVLAVSDDFLGWSDLFGKMHEFLSEDDRRKIEGANLQALLEDVGQASGRPNL